jgi:predicted amidohydrolase
MTVRIAVVQPRSYAGAREAENVALAIRYLEEAAELGARIVCFPELYPGPAGVEVEFDADELYGAARRLGLYVLRGKREPASEGKHHICVELIGRDGMSKGVYRRTTPAGPYIYFDIDVWNFHYEPGDELPVFETEYGTIGMLVCSEVYMPELSRILALRGAEIVFYPAGGLINELIPTWRVMLQARAIENLMFTAVSQNLYGVEPGVAMIAGPEGVLASTDEPGVLVADLDLDRARWLREESEKIEMPKQYKVIPGTLEWRRPSLYEQALDHL